MSIRLMAAIFESDLAPTERLIMLALADHADDSGRCYPSIQRLCERTGLKERAVQINLAKLTLSGHLRVDRGGGRRNTSLYVITINPAQDAPFTPGNPAQDAPFAAENPAQDAPFDEPKPRTACALSDENPAYYAENPALNAPEPSRTTIERKKESAYALLRIPADFDAFWQTYPHRGGARKGRKAAEAAYVRALKAGTPAPDILAGAERYRSDRQALSGYAKDPATWLNQRCWGDDIEPEANIIKIGGSNGPSPRPGAAFGAAHREFTRRLAAGEINRGPDPSDPFPGG